MADLARRLLVATVLCGATSLACPSPSHAQVPSPGKDPTGAWFQITPYLWMASIQGENTIGDETIPIDVDFGDIWSALKFAFSFHFEGGKNHGLGGVDFAYIRVGEDDARVDHRHRHARVPGGEIPGLGQVHERVMPLATILGIVRNGPASNESVQTRVLHAGLDRGEAV